MKILFIIFLFLSCQAQDNEKPSLREALIGKWNSVEYGSSEEIHHRPFGTLVNGYATGFLLNDDGSYGLFNDDDNDGVPDHLIGEIPLGKYWDVYEEQLVFIDPETGNIHFRYDIESVSKNELILSLPASPSVTEGFYIKFVRQ